VRVFVGSTGASGQVYTVRLLEILTSQGIEVEFTATDHATKVMEREGVEPPDNVRAYDPEDVTAPPASGTHRIDAYVVCPCTLNTMACIAHGIGNDLVKRAALVALKEGRTLVVVPRETPWPRQAFEAALKLIDSGAVILPASPAFYHRPETVDEIVDYVVQKILDVIGVDVDMIRYRG